MAKRGTQFQTIRTEGALLPPDILQLVASLKVDGTNTAAFHLPPGIKINEAISQSWNSLRTHWAAFQNARKQHEGKESESETGTAITNSHWLLPLFKELEFGRLVTSKSPVIDDKAYPIERFYNHAPIHFVGYKLSLDRRTKGARGAALASPHSMVQEFLNRSNEHLWAFLSNGLQLRILRDNISLSRQAFVEFDLESMMEGEVYSDFAILWLLCHQSRVESEKPEECWLEKWSKLARDQGTRVLNDLRNGVTSAIEALGQGFISHQKNEPLRERLRSGDLSKDDFYRQILRVVYRMLFLFVAEDRDLLHPPDATDDSRQLYESHYSTSRLRELAFRIRGSKHSDLWHSLSLIFDALGRNEGCPELALNGLGSFLWRRSSTPDLNGPVGNWEVGSSQVGSREVGRNDEINDSSPTGYSLLATPSTPTGYSLLANSSLLQAVRALAYVEQNKTLRNVDYRNLGTEELGSVYESLLELHPEVHIEAKTFELKTAAGNERKTTGSYYTPDSLVQCLLDSALDPVVEERLKEARELANSQSGIGKKEERNLPDWFRSISIPDRDHLLATGYSPLAEQALLALKVCDPACGSGHFLIAAAHRLARHLARIRTGETEPSPEDYQRALRDVIGRCIYGVDINPMAVELCKVSLWMEAIEPGKPLSFLDHHIQCGNSLLGTTPALLAKGIPDDAFKPIEGDEKSVCTSLKKDNKRERENYASGQGYLFAPTLKLGNLPATIAKLNSADDATLSDVAAKEEMYAELVKGTDYRNARLLADTWCAAFVWKKDQSDLGQLCPTERNFRDIENNPHSINIHVKAEVERLAGQYQLLHWHLAFPDVFRLLENEASTENEQVGWNGGFDVVLGNPPWERIKIQEQEWFAERAPEIADAPNTASRRHLISRLAIENPTFYDDWIAAKRRSECESEFVRFSGLFPLCGRGDVNTFSVFTELNTRIVSTNGRVGCVVPTGIATDDTTKHYFNMLASSRRVISLFDFSNDELLFPEVRKHQHFCLFTVAGRESLKKKNTQYAFFLTNPSQLHHSDRVFELSANDIALINPNSNTLPTFLNRTNAAITIHLYRRLPVLWRECDTGGNSWSISFMRMFDVSNDSALFRRKEELIDDHNVTLHSDSFVGADGTEYVPLFDAKMAQQYNHRAANLSLSGHQFRKVSKDSSAVDQLRDPNYKVTPAYWISNTEVEDRISRWPRKWLLGFKDVTGVTSERLASFSVLPRCGVGHPYPVVFLESDSIGHANLLSVMNTFLVEFVLRQKMQGLHLTYFILKQLPIPHPNSFALPCGFAECSLSEFVLPRVIELSYTAWDVQAFGLDCGYNGPPFEWSEERRYLVRCELDAANFHSYLGPSECWATDSPELCEMFSSPRNAVEYIMESLLIIKRKDEQAHGEYRTKRVILEIYDEMAEAIRTGQPYQTRLNPSPGPPTDADGNFIPMAEWDVNNWPSHIHKPRDSEV